MKNAFKKWLDRCFSAGIYTENNDAIFGCIRKLYCISWSHGNAKLVKNEWDLFQKIENKKYETYPDVL